MKPNSYEELTRLISALLDDRLASEESQRLEALLAADADARKLYLQMIDQEVELSCFVASEIPVEEIDIVPEVPPWSREEPFRARSRWWEIAAVVALLAVFLFVLYGRPDRPAKQAVRPIPAERQVALVETWSEDFEKGAIGGWTGKLVTENLPPGSRFGITSVPMRYPGDVVYGVKLPEDWKRGLFQLTERSTLHVTYRLGTSGGINVFMHTIAPDADGGEFRMYHAVRKNSLRKPGPWQTASMPFSLFLQKIPTPGGTIQFAGAPPGRGEVVATLMFSTPDENDLVIDRVWVTPDGSGQEEERPISSSP